MAAYLLALLMGAGMSQSEMTLDEYMELGTFTAAAIASARKFGEDIFSGKYDGEDGEASVEIRISLWVGGLEAVYDYGQAMDPTNPYLKWVWSPEKEHCFDCTRLNGQIHRASEWRQSGIFPRSYDLECRGFYCGCKWVKTSGPGIGEF